MSSRFIRTSSWLLSIFLIFSLIGLPTAYAATGPSASTQKKALEAAVGQLPNHLPKQKLELTNKRTPYSTRYLNPDGSFTEDIYLEPQYYQDPTDKTWKTINNTLKSKPNGAGQLENTANAFHAQFAPQAGTDPLVSVDKDGKSISLLPVKASSTKGVATGNAIKYPALFPDADVQYAVQNDGVKENIILDRYNGTSTFSFEVSLKGAKGVVEKDGTISFVDDKGHKLWYFAAPFMTDAKGNYSDQVKLSLREAGGKTFVDVVADPNFLQDPATQYPVTIDPTINNWDVQRDNFISSAFPTTAYSSNTMMYTGQDSGTYKTTRSLLQFYLPSLPSDSKISSANINAYQTKNDATTVSIDAYRIANSWTSSVNWNTQPTLASTPLSTATSNAVNAYWQWDITQLAKDWYNGVQPNYGVMLKQQNESTSPFRQFNTVNAGNMTPRLTINYTVDPIGLESFWSVTKDQVNPANGNLVFGETDVSLTGRGIPVEVTRTYNNRKSMQAGLFGYGWTANMESQLVDAGAGPITLVEGDGTRHIFGQSPNGNGQYVANGGIYLTLTKNADGTYTITNNDGSKTNYNTSGKIASLVGTNGNTTTFTYDASGKITAMKDASGRTTTIAYGTNGYVSSITDPANRTVLYAYDAAGNLTQVTDPAGHAKTYAYDSTHNLTGITNARNITTTLEYDASDRVTKISNPITIDGTTTTTASSYVYDTTNSVTSVTDGEGHRVDYTYNANGNVVQITENPLDSANKAVTTFAYDDNNNLTKVVDPNVNATNGTDAYVYTYDAKGNVTGVQLPENQTASNTYDSTNNLVSAEDFNSNTSNFDYDLNNNQTEATDANAQTAAERYDTNGNLLSSTQQMSAADNLVANSSFELDANADNWADNWTQDIEPGKSATYAWSSTAKFGNKAVSISNPTGWALASSDMIPYSTGSNYVVSAYVKTSGITNTAIVKVAFYDSLGNYLGQKYSYQLKGTHDWTRIQAVVDSVPAGTTQVKVSVGLNAGSGTASFDGVQLEKGTILSAYNLVDNSSFERNQGVGTLPANWSSSGNLSTSDGVVKNVNNGDNNVYSGTYSMELTGEAAKNKYIKQHINISGDAGTPFTLSGWSKQVGANPNGGYYALQVAINQTDGTVDWSNANDFSTTATDWQHVAALVKAAKPFTSIDVYYYYYGQAGTAWFDSMRLEKGASQTFHHYDANGNYVTEIDDPVGNKLSYTYDAAGNETSVTDEKGLKTSYTYDALNNLTQITDANGGGTSYGYDATGDRTSVTDANGHVTTYGFNEFNKVSTVTNPLNQKIQYGYDKNGKTTNVTSPKGDVLSYTYNASSMMSGIYSNGVKKWGYAYDATGNLTSVTDAAGNTSAYTYDKDNRVTELTSGTDKLDYGYDANSNLKSLAFTSGASTVSLSYSYDTLNQLITLARNGANQARFVYDERGNVVSITYANGNYSAYEYEDDNRLQTVKNYNNAGALLDSYLYSYDANSNVASIVTNFGTISYQYDNLNQLTKETLVDGTAIAYAYDKAGNRISKTVTQGTTSTTTNYTYDAANELTKVDGQAYAYDANGNLTSNGAKTFVYDEQDRLMQVKDASGASLATYTYDDHGNRTSKTTPSGTTYFHYDGDKVVYESDASHNITAEYTWDAAGKPVSMTQNGTTYYYTVNGHGDVTTLTDSNGTVVAQYQYDSFGNITSQTGTMATQNPYRYAGYRYDDETGLYYLMARYFDPKVGRFLTRDTFIGMSVDTQSLNLYAYTQNNPVRYTDASGHSPDDEVRAAILKKAADYLGPRGLNLTFQTFFWALYANGKTYTNSLMVTKLKQSSEIAAIKKELFRTSYGRYVHYHSPTELLMLNQSGWFSSTKDLAYSVGKANYNAYAVKSYGIWSVAIRVWDRYDFDEWRWPTSVGSGANDLGLLMQRQDMLTPYSWNFRFNV